jgi:hypothetical protein
MVRPCRDLNLAVGVGVDRNAIADDRVRYLVAELVGNGGTRSVADASDLADQARVEGGRSRSRARAWSPLGLTSIRLACA